MICRRLAILAEAGQTEDGVSNRIGFTKEEEMDESCRDRS